MAVSDSFRAWPARMGAISLAAIAFLSISGCGASSTDPAGATSAAFRLGYGALGSGHKEMAATTSMPGMNMSGSGSNSATGTYLSKIPRGRALLRQDGDQLSGSVTVSGLPPGSHHAMYLRGPANRCRTLKASVKTSVALPDLVADAQGNAHVQIDLTVAAQVVRYGYSITVLRDPTLAEVNQIGSATTAKSNLRSPTTDPMVLCGNV